MRIDKLELWNFKNFSTRSFDFHPHFTLLIGDNGTGKTSILDALAVSLGIWLVNVPDSKLNNSRRNIMPTEIRLVPQSKGDRLLFQEVYPVVVSATGSIGHAEKLTWIRQIKTAGGKTSNADAKLALDLIKEIYERDAAGAPILCPVIAYYGAGRAWLPSNQARRSEEAIGPQRRWAAFYDCFNERIRFSGLQAWFMSETIEMGNRQGKPRPGYEVVRRAVMRCVPGADDIWYDADRKQIAISIAGKAQPFDNLSAGQRMMLALVADIAIKAVTQNSYLLVSEDGELAAAEQLSILEETPGVVLIDELDVHLHPKWQTRIVNDLRRTFPKIQFIATTHSPFLIQSLQPGELIQLDERSAEDYADKSIEDIAEHIMGLDHPQKSRRYYQMLEAAESYFRLLREPHVKEEELRAAEDSFAEFSIPFSDDPAFHALLRAEKAASKKGKGP